MPTKLSPSDVDHLIAAHRNGESVLSLSNRLGVSRPAITRAMRKRGVEPRGRSDTERLKWQRIKQDPEAVRRQVSAANEASRGKPKSQAHKVKLAARAESMAVSGHRVGMFETDILDALRQRGVECAPQRQVAEYNLDIATYAPPVAVEIHSYHPGRDRMIRIAQRTEDILDRGWWCIFVVVSYPSRRFDLAPCTDQIVAFREFASRNQHAISPQYGVIKGDGKPSASPSFNFNNLPRIPGF